MEAMALIQCWRNFWNEKNQLEKVYKSLLKGKPWVKIDYGDIAKSSIELSEELLNNPEDVIKAGEIVISELELGDTKPQNLSLRIFKLPESCIIHPWQLRSENIGKFVALKGLITKASGVGNLCDSAKYECLSCGNELVVQMGGETTLREPRICGCGRKSGFVLKDQIILDAMKIGIGDDLFDEINIGRRVAQSKLGVLMKDLTCHAIDKLIRPARKIIANGYLKPRRNNKVVLDVEFIINSIEFIEIGWDNIQIMPSVKDQILKAAQSRTLITDMASSIADIVGYEELKVALLLQLFGAPNIYDSNNKLVLRGTIHILVPGNPGGGKSYMAIRAGSISPIYSFQSAITSSGKGLIASVVFDKELGTWVVHAGVVPMAHKGIVVIDEMDKTHPDEYGEHNNAMNDMQVVITKANARAILDTETSYLATSNPKDRVFNEYSSYYSQINMPKDFLDRFDLVMPIKQSNKKEDRHKIYDAILDRYLAVELQTSWKPKYTHSFMREYIAYCRQNNPRPVFSIEMKELVKTQLDNLMKPKNEEEMQVSFRHAERVMRFVYASARLHLRDVTIEDIRLALELQKYSLKSLGIIDESGAYNWNVAENVDIDTANKNIKIRDILEKEIPRKELVEIEHIIQKCEAAGISRWIAEREIELMRRNGELTEQRRGRITWVG